MGSEGRRYLGLDVQAHSRIALINTDNTTPDKGDLTPRRTHRLEC